MGYETCLHLVEVNVEPPGRAEVERLLDHPEEERDEEVREYLKLLAMDDAGYLYFRINPEDRLCYPYAGDEDDPDDDGLAPAMNGKWYEAERFAHWLCRHEASGQLILHSLEADGVAFGWEFEDGRITYLQLLPCGPVRQLKARRLADTVRGAGSRPAVGFRCSKCTLGVQTKMTERRQVNRFGAVVDVLTGLGWRKCDDEYLVLDDERGCFVQVACLRPGRFILEWRGGGPLQDPERGLLRAQAWSPRGRILHKINRRKGHVGLYESEVLGVEHVVDILLVFWLGQPRPRYLYWRPIGHLVCSTAGCASKG